MDSACECVRVCFVFVDFKLPLFLKPPDVGSGDGTPGPFLIQEEEGLASAGGGGDWSLKHRLSRELRGWPGLSGSCVSDPFADFQLGQDGLFEIVEPAVCFHLSLKASVEFRIDQRDFSLH